MRKKLAPILLLNPLYYRRHILLDRFTTRDLIDLQSINDMARPIAGNFHNNYRKTYHHSNCHHSSIPSSLLFPLPLYTFFDNTIIILYIWLVVIVIFHIPSPFPSSLCPHSLLMFCDLSPSCFPDCYCSINY